MGRAAVRSRDEGGDALADVIISRRDIEDRSCVAVNVDEPGRDDLAANVEHTTSPLGDGLRDSNDCVASNRNIGLVPGIARSIDDPAVAEQQIVGRALGTRKGGEQDRNETSPRHYRSPCGLVAALVSAFQRIAV